MFEHGSSLREVSAINLTVVFGHNLDLWLKIEKRVGSWISREVLTCWKSDLRSVKVRTSVWRSNLWATCTFGWKARRGGEWGKRKRSLLADHELIIQVKSNGICLSMLHNDSLTLTVFYVGTHSLHVFRNWSEPRFEKLIQDFDLVNKSKMR